MKNKATAHAGGLDLDLLDGEAEARGQRSLDQFGCLYGTGQFGLVGRDVGHAIDWLHGVVSQERGGVGPLDSLAGPGKGALRITDDMA